MKHVIVGTAGHIDHGKSALVRALTGTDPDRLEEEKRRGITIDIGFANLDFDEQYRLGFVDVPGHERFIKNMLAGITGIDLLVFVVAADESIQPQTREHFDICRLLEVRKGIVVITKADLVDRDILELVKLELEEFVAGSFLQGAPVIAVSSRTGEGLDRLKQELQRLAAEVPAKDSSRYFRLPIDRSFVMKGFGPVVTGTLVSGKIEKEAEVEVHPSRTRLRVRGIQVHNEPVDAAYAGQRTALNIAGTGSGELARGMNLTEPDRFQSTSRTDCLLHLLGSASPLRNEALVHFHTGTSEVVAKAIMLETGPDGKKNVEPGASAYVQFRLRDPVLLLPGDRFIIRQISPLVTIGGGRVLDNWVGRRASRAAFASQKLDRNFLDVLSRRGREEILEALLKERPSDCLGAEDLIARTGWLEEELRQAAYSLRDTGKVNVLSDSPLLIAKADDVERLSQNVLKSLESFHKQNPLLPGMSKEALRTKVFARAHPVLTEAVLCRLAARNEAVISGETVKLASHKIVLKEEEEDAKRRIAQAFERAGLAVPSVKDVLRSLPLDQQRAERLLLLLIKDKVLVRVSEDLVFHSQTIGNLLQMISTYRSKRDRINVAGFKDLTHVSRKYAIPLLEYLDREHVTRREGDERILL